MRYAILGDVHSNWEALSAVLEDAAELGVSAYVSIGDIVGYNPDPARCMDKLNALGCITVRGNHDHYCAHSPGGASALAAAAAIAVTWTRRQLDDEHVRSLRDLPLSARVEDFTIVHNTLSRTAQWNYVFNTAEAAEHFDKQDTQVCFHGHTHVPVAWKKRGRVTVRVYHRLKIAEGTRYFINVGSVGQPRDRDPCAAYAVYDLEAREVELRRVSYDIAATQAKIVKAGLPEWLAVRLSLGM